MAKLYFRYGAMGCSKTANALMVAFNYDEKGLKPLVIKPSKDTRDEKKVIKSRIGLERPCLFVEECIKNTFEETVPLVKDYDAIIVDEVQFCSIDQIKVLEEIVKKLRIPVMCYGLKTDFRLNLFPASEYLLSIEDCVKEKLRTVCWCGEGADCNARLDANGNVIRNGEQIMVGGNESYTSLCEKHYWHGDIGPILKAKYAKKKEES